MYHASLDLKSKCFISLEVSLFFFIFPHFSTSTYKIPSKAQFDAGERCRACGDGCVNAACLPTAAEIGGKACWIAGWGTTQENGNSPATMSSGYFSIHSCFG